VPGSPCGAAPFPAALPAAHEQVRMLRLTPVQRGGDETAPSVVRLVKGSRMEGMIVHVVGQDFVCQRRDLRWNLSKRRAWLWNYAYRPGPLKGRARRSRSCRGTRWWRCRTGSFAGGSSVLSICGRDGEGNAPALPGPAGLPRANRHAARGRLRTRRYQAARGDPGRVNVGLVGKTGGCGSSPSSTPSAAADGGR